MKINAGEIKGTDTCIIHRMDWHIPVQMAYRCKQSSSLHCSHKLLSAQKTHQSPQDHCWNLNTKKLPATITLKESTYKEKVGRMETRHGFLLTAALMDSVSLQHVLFLHLPKQNVWKKQGLKPFIWILSSCSVQPGLNLSLILCKSSVNSQGKGSLFSKNVWEVPLRAKDPELCTYKHVSVPPFAEPRECK